MLGLGVFVLDVLVFVMLVLGLVFVQFVRAKFGVVFSMRLGYVGGEFGAVDGASGFDFRGFFFGEFRDSRDRRFFSFLGTLIGKFFRIFFFKFGAADDGIGFCSLRSFFMLGFDESGSERGDLVFVKFGFISPASILLPADSSEGSATVLPVADASSAAPVASAEGAVSPSGPASARSQRGKPPEKRRGTLLPLGAVAGRLPAARGVISSTVF